MSKFNFKLTGVMPLLMHSDDYEAADMLKTWREAPENKNKSQRGDDRSPAWTWQTYVYHDNTEIVMPSANIMAALRAAGAQLTLKGAKTFKEMTQTGLLISSESCKFLNNGKPVKMSFLEEIRELPFTEQARRCKAEGFELFGKRAPISSAKHLRIRPKFKNWVVEGTILVSREEITPDILARLFTLSGLRGLCDWRPGCKTPGPYGQYDAAVTPVTAKVAV